MGARGSVSLIGSKVSSGYLASAVVYNCESGAVKDSKSIVDTTIGEAF